MGEKVYKSSVEKYLPDERTFLNNHVRLHTETVNFLSVLTENLHNVKLLPLALQPTVGFGLSKNILPFYPIYHQLSPSSHS